MSVILLSRVYPVGEKCCIALKAEQGFIFDPETEYTLQTNPFSGFRHYGPNKVNLPSGEETAFLEKHVLALKDGVLATEICFPQEDSYYLRIYAGEIEIARIEVYALKEDLFCLTPYKGDNHMHTYYSDGKDTPMYMSAASCRRGYDFCTITDHYRSWLCQVFFAHLKGDPRVSAQ